MKSSFALLQVIIGKNDYVYANGWEDHFEKFFDGLQANDPVIMKQPTLALVGGHPGERLTIELDPARGCLTAYGWNGSALPEGPPESDYSVVVVEPDLISTLEDFERFASQSVLGKLFFSPPDGGDLALERSYKTLEVYAVGLPIESPLANATHAPESVS